MKRLVLVLGLAGAVFAGRESWLLQGDSSKAIIRADVIPVDAKIEIWDAGEVYELSGLELSKILAHWEAAHKSQVQDR